MLTQNEKNVLKTIFTSFEDNSINAISKKCHLAPNGAMKILKKFEKENILKPKKISNLISYKINFEDEKTRSILQLALISELKGRLKFRYGDLKDLKGLTESAIIFGSYTDLKKDPNDLDLLIILKKNDFEEYKKESSRIFKTMPIKIHEVLQTQEDFKGNLIKKDKIILEILKTGIILWGQDKIINFIENEHKRQA
jgi:hypothetical protein